MVDSGKYRELCDEVRRDAQAEAVVLVVLNGSDGQVFVTTRIADWVNCCPQSCARLHRISLI